MDREISTRSEKKEIQDAYLVSVLHLMIQVLIYAFIWVKRKLVPPTGFQKPNIVSCTDSSGKCG